MPFGNQFYNVLSLKHERLDVHGCPSVLLTWIRGCSRPGMSGNGGVLRVGRFSCSLAAYWTPGNVITGSYPCLSGSLTRLSNRAGRGVACCTLVPLDCRAAPEDTGQRAPSMCHAQSTCPQRSADTTTRWAACKRITASTWSMMPGKSFSARQMNHPKQKPASVQ
jgi:hypothetical protein